jgi:hypothetical protein
MNSSSKPIYIVRYRELNRRLQLSSVNQRIEILRRSIETARQELRQLENLLTGGAA